jgi:predicted RecB family nuclease
VFRLTTEGSLQVDGASTEQWLEEIVAGAGKLWSQFRQGLEEIIPDPRTPLSSPRRVPLKELSGIEALLLAEVSGLLRGLGEKLARPPRNLWWTPERLAHAEICRHSWYMECHGDPTVRSSEPLTSRAARTALDDYADAGFAGRNWQEALGRTQNLMKAGHRLIVRPALQNGSWRGGPDLLRKVQGPSRLGEFSYEPAHRLDQPAAETRDATRLAASARLLEEALGRRPGRGWYWRSGRAGAEPLFEVVELDSHQERVESLIQEMEEFRREPPFTTPLRCQECDRCPWRADCQRRWLEEQSICLLHGVSDEVAQKVHGAGFWSIDDLLRAPVQEIGDRLGWRRDAAEVLSLRARARKEGTPQLLKPPSIATGRPTLYYRCGNADGTVYLHGVIRRFQGRSEEQTFIAASAADEREAWYEFLKFLAQDEEPLIYRWGRTDRSLLEALWDKYGGNPKGYYHLRHHLADQCAFVREHFALPTQSYGLQEVAPFFGFDWPEPTSTRSDWLRTRNPATLQQLVREDLSQVRAMVAVDSALREIL